MRFMWPTWPIVGLQRRSRRSSMRLPPCAAGEPDEPEPFAVVLEELLDADLPHGRFARHGRPVRLPISSRETRRPAPPRRARASSWSRNARSENICASSDRSCRCWSVACSGTSSTNTWSTGLPSGASNAIGCAQAHERAHAPRASPWMRPCGMAMPWPSRSSRASRAPRGLPRRPRARSPALRSNDVADGRRRTALWSRRRGRRGCCAAGSRAAIWFMDGGCASIARTQTGGS